MKVVHLNSSQTTGGAAIAARRLNDAMVSSSIDSSMLTIDMVVDGGGGKFNFVRKTLFKFAQKVNRLSIPAVKTGKGLFSTAIFGSAVARHKLIRESDVVYLHWVNNSFISLRSVEHICRSAKRVIIFMHDMWHITGGCHYSFMCNNYTSSCVDCPMFVHLKHNTVATKQMAHKKAIFAKHPSVRVVAPSGWLVSCAQNSAIFATHQATVIANVLSFNIYKKIDRHSARRAMNLPLDKKIICFGAFIGVDNPYKGWSFLRDALLILDGGVELEVLIFGAEQDPDIESQVPFKCHFTGHLNNDKSLVEAYSAVDLFISPSLADNFPNTILEAMACGVPVVGFDVGGIPDMIDHNKTGYLAKYRDSADLAVGIKTLLELSDAQYDEVSAAAVRKARQMSDISVVIPKHRAAWEN